MGKANDLLEAYKRLTERYKGFYRKRMTETLQMEYKGAERQVLSRRGRRAEEQKSRRAEEQKSKSDPSRGFPLQGSPGFLIRSRDLKFIRSRGPHASHLPAIDHGSLDYFFLDVGASPRQSKRLMPFSISVTLCHSVSLHVNGR